MTAQTRRRLIITDTQQAYFVICALLSIAIIVLTVLLLVAPVIFMPLHLAGIDDSRVVSARVILGCGLPNLCGLLGIFFGTLGLHDIRHKKGHAHWMELGWAYWMYILTITLGLMTVVKTAVFLWMVATV